ncbi:MAG TPA: alpha/beta hydrolase [Candidatus Binataceae bacterium]|nr:alpha/beta hydrolase [Candidatus Binataceae bacterium]
MASAEYRECTVNVGDTSIHYLVGGSGTPVVVLHGFDGNPGWLPVYDELARRFTVYAPTHPGFAGSERPPWLESFVDLSRFYLWILQELDLTWTTLLGFSIGGWLAAEIAAMSPATVERLILVDAMGIKPREGEIADIFLHGSEGTRRLAILDPKQVPNYELLFGRKPSTEEREATAINREAAIRYCWKPYMHDPALPFLLPRLHKVPSLIVWGKEDRIVPLESAELYRRALRDAKLELIERCGHLPHLERPAEFLRVVNDFLV